MSSPSRLFLTCVAIVIAIVASAAPAQAKAPPRGKYDCTISGNLFGVLTIKSKGRYSHRGSSGTFRAKGGSVRFPDGIVAWRISFKGGSLGGMKGRWHRTSDGVDEIALKNPINGFESIYCDRR